MNAQWSMRSAAVGATVISTATDCPCLLGRPVWREAVLASLILAIWTSFGSGRLAYGQSDGLVLENDSVLMVFDECNGNLCSFLDKKTGTELLSERDGTWKVTFGIEYTQKGGNLIWTDNCGAQEFSCQLRHRKRSTEFSGAWEYYWGKGGARVILTVVLPSDSGLSTWKMRVDMTGDARLERVTVPFLSGIGKLGDSGEDDRLLVPEQNGRLFIDPSEKLGWWGQQYPSGFATMQFMAYYDDRAGFYLASRDRRGLSKFLNWDRKNKNWAAMKIIYQGLSSTGNRKSFRTEVGLGVFHGDWVTAASLYRDWAEKQPWAKSTIRSKGTPGWLTEIGIGKDYYLGGRKGSSRSYEDWVLKIEEHTGFFSIPTLAMLWGWEHGGTWASGDYFPPRGGWEAFDKAVQRVRSSNAYPYLFIRAELVRENSPAWESARGQRAALRDGRGQRVGGRHVQMCLESDEWLSYLKEVTYTLAHHGVGLIQLDGLPWAALKTCHSRNHKHGAVLGSSTRPYKVANNLLALRSELRASHPDVALSGEGGAELYLPALDVFHSRDCWGEATDRKAGSGLAQVVPLFNFVYHEQIVFLDEYNLGLWRHLGGRQYHNLAVGRCFTWGEVCSYNMQDWLKDQGNQAVFSLLERCAKARAGYLRDFLVFGRMLPPPDVQGPFIEAESENRKFKGKIPSVLSSAWQSDQGDVAIIVLNIGEQDLETSLSLLPYFQYLKSGCRMEIYRNRDLEKTARFDPTDPVLPIQLAPLQFAALILRS